MKFGQLLVPVALLAVGAMSADAAGVLLPVNTSFSGGTVYGATGYVQLNNVNPTYLANNITGNTDILTSPGGGYQTANPVVGNNVAEYGLSDTPYVFGWTGGTGGLSGAAFGAGITGADAGGVGFALSDTSVGCCTASYMITSTDSDYQVGGAGYTGTFGAYLSISGANATANDAAVASAMVYYRINGGAFAAMDPLVLAAGGNCNNVAIGGAGGTVAAIAENGGCTGNTFTGLAIDNLGAVNWAAGTTVEIVATLTAYADPMATDNFFSIQPDGDLLSQLGPLPTFSGDANTSEQAPTPEPATLGVCGLALVGLGLLRRRKATGKG